MNDCTYLGDGGMPLVWLQTSFGPRKYSRIDSDNGRKLAHRTNQTPPTSNDGKIPCTNNIIPSIQKYLIHQLESLDPIKPTVSPFILLFSRSSSLPRLTMLLLLLIFFFSSGLFVLESCRFADPFAMPFM